MVSMEDFGTYTTVLQNWFPDSEFCLLIVEPHCDNV